MDMALPLDPMKNPNPKEIRIRPKYRIMRPSTISNFLIDKLLT